MSRPVRAPTGCLPHATAHDKRTPACRPPEFLFPRRFNCGTWRGNRNSAGPFPTGNTPPIPADSATRSCTKRRRHQVQPRRRRESWLPYVMNLEAAPRRSSNQTRNQRHQRLFSYLDRASYAPCTLGHTFYFSARPPPSPLSNDPVFPLFTPPFADNLPFYEDT